MKTVFYRGGILKFQIPRHWKEEYEEEGGGTFYEDSADSGTLRLNVLTFESESPLGENSSQELLKSISKQPEAIIENLPDKLSAMLSYSEYTQDGDDLLKMCFWNIANRIPPKHQRIALFSYCFLASQENSARIKDDLSMLNQSLRKCVFALEPGR